MENIGRCRFCGQQVMLDEKIDYTEKQRVEEATLRCECDDAKAYKEKYTQKKRAVEKVRKVFQEMAAGGRLKEELGEYLEEITKMICDGEIKGIIVDIRQGERLTIKINAKEKVKIKKEKKKQEEYEE